jgi:hypothetical protein
MISTAFVSGLKAHQMIARGEAPGNRAQESQALKGRNKISMAGIVSRICVALTGLDWFGGRLPGASPRVITLRPCGTGECGGVR